MRSLSTMLILLLLLGSPGCRGKSPIDRSSRLDLVLNRMRETASMDDRRALDAAMPVSDLEDIPVEAVGFRVPIPGHDRRAFVMFEVDYFDSESIERLAAEALDDFARAKAEAESADSG